MSGAGLKVVLHDYSGHPFQVELASELVRRGHRVHHCYSDSMQTPQGALARRDDDLPTFSIAPVSLGRLWRSTVRRSRKYRRGPCA